MVVLENNIDLSRLDDTALDKRSNVKLVTNIYFVLNIKEYIYIEYVC